MNWIIKAVFSFSVKTPWSIEQLNINDRCFIILSTAILINFGDIADLTQSLIFL